MRFVDRDWDWVPPVLLGAILAVLVWSILSWAQVAAAKTKCQAVGWEWAEGGMGWDEYCHSVVDGREVRAPLDSLVVPL